MEALIVFGSIIILFFMVSVSLHVIETLKEQDNESD
jgi:hypothetical protein